jgi:abortive infection bacteriophage resistance protein
MSQLNPKLEPGDRIVLLHMDDPYSAVRMGTKGTVLKIVRVPFDMGYQYNVKWDDGSVLDLLPETDSWVLATDVKSKKNLTTEEFSQELKTLSKHKDIIKNMDYRPVLDFLKLVQKSGLVNMLQARVFLMSDSKNLHKLIYKFDGEPEDYPELFENIDEVRNILINETIRIMQEQNMEFDDSTVNRVFQKVCSAVMEMYISLYSSYFKK